MRNSQNQVTNEKRSNDVFMESKPNPSAGQIKPADMTEFGIIDNPPPDTKQVLWYAMNQPQNTYMWYQY